MNPHISVAIAGGGVVGLSIAQELATTPELKLALNRGVAVFEKSRTLGEGQSGRNSGVIHAGIYYQPGSLKAKLCAEGRERLRIYASLHFVPWAETGKLIVATSQNEESLLEMYLRRALDNGLEEGKDIALITRTEAKSLAPNIECIAALYSKRSGIIDAASYIQALRRNVLRQGAEIFMQQEIIDVRPTNDYVEFDVRIKPHAKIHPQPVETYRADYFVNATGLFADKIARMINPDFSPHIVPIRGEYCTYTITRDELSINNLNIYPTPTIIKVGEHEKTILGIHLTPTFSLGSSLESEKTHLGKTVLVGPSARRVESPDDLSTRRYAVDYFYEHAVKILPALRKEDLHSGYAGIRAALDDYDDIVFEPDKKFPRCLQIVGSDSPFLTASAAAGWYARKVLRL